MTNDDDEVPVNLATTMAKGVDALRTAVFSVKERTTANEISAEQQRERIDRLEQEAKHNAVTLALHVREMERLAQQVDRTNTAIWVGDSGRNGVVVRLELLETDVRKLAQGLTTATANFDESHNRDADRSWNLWIAVISAIISGILGFLGGFFTK